MRRYLMYEIKINVVSKHVETKLISLLLIVHMKDTVMLYIHFRLLERFSINILSGGETMTEIYYRSTGRRCLHIPTNVISITDG